MASANTASATCRPDSLRALAAAIKARLICEQASQQLRQELGLGFLWITGVAVWGREAAMERFRALYSGTWRLEPDMAKFRAVALGPEAAQLFVPVLFTIGAAGQPAQQTSFLMNQTLRREGDAWRVASILPIPLPPNWRHTNWASGRDRRRSEDCQRRGRSVLISFGDRLRASRRCPIVAHPSRMAQRRDSQRRGWESAPPAPPLGFLPHEAPPCAKTARAA
jgi:hypothetical protein